MEETQFTREIVEEHFPDECQEVGETALHQVLSAPQTSEPTKLHGAHEHDLTAVLATLAAVVTLVRESIGIYKELRALGHQPTADEVTEKLGSAEASRIPGGEAKRNEIVASVVRRFGREEEHDPGEVR